MGDSVTAALEAAVLRLTRPELILGRAKRGPGIGAA
jgi:hypothetical protein